MSTTIFTIFSARFAKLSDNLEKAEQASASLYKAIAEQAKANAEQANEKQAETDKAFACASNAYIAYRDSYKAISSVVFDDKDEKRAERACALQFAKAVAFYAKACSDIAEQASKDTNFDSASAKAVQAKAFVEATKSYLEYISKDKKLCCKAMFTDKADNLVVADRLLVSFYACINKRKQQGKICYSASTSVSTIEACAVLFLKGHSFFDYDKDVNRFDNISLYASKLAFEVSTNFVDNADYIVNKENACKDILCFVGEALQKAKQAEQAKAKALKFFANYLK